MKKKVSFILILVCAFSLQIVAQNLRISGVVRDAEAKSTLPGVNVVVKGLNQGVITDIDGRFSLNVPAGAVLKFSFVGFETQEMVVSTSQSVDIKLKPVTMKMNEVVVIGYGTS
ncbi:MAG: carboxypeptidase-like regulatory domain-containing protein, partial [Bacteroidota bacterium]|nr:carboxypeptidase-like regulatory domain-containing protein [Bacteroidota bacterium]